MDKKDLRDKNLEILHTALKKLRLASKPQLAKFSGLSVVTVNTLLQELLAADEAIETKETSSCGGRPAQQYRFNAEKKVALSVCMNEKNGSDTMFIAVINLLGITLEYAEIPLKKVTIEAFKKNLIPYITQYPQTEIIFMGLPGFEIHGRLIIDYPELQNINFCECLEEKLGRPVYLENDINAAIAGYGYSLGNESLSETIIGIFFPQKYLPGAGILQSGRLYKGRNGAAGEIGAYFKYAGAYKTTDDLRKAADAILLFTRTWNPDRIVIYNEALHPEKINKVIELCEQEIPAEFLPPIVIKQNMYEDYGMGICRLATECLTRKNRK